MASSFSPLHRQYGEADVYLKIILLGDAGTGKTSLMLNYTDPQLNGIGNGDTRFEHSLDTASKTIERNDQTIQLEIRDTAGMERYRSLTKSHYNGASGALILFDLTDEKTFHNVTHWFEDLRHYCDHPDRIQVMLVGTQCNNKDQRAVTPEKIAKMAEHYDAAMMEVSIREGVHVTDVFDKLVDLILETHPDFAGRDGQPMFLPYPSTTLRGGACGENDEESSFVSCSGCCGMGGEKPKEVGGVG